MHRELLLKAFEKVRGELEIEGHKDPSDSKCANRLSEIVSEDFPYGEKSFRKLYKKTRTNPEDDIQIPRQEVLNALSQYLGYEDYKNFVLMYSRDEVSKAETKRIAPENKSKLTRILITLFLIAIISFFGYNYFTQQRWMEWQETHYVETSFDAEKLKASVLKVYKAERIESFWKLNPNCATQFFNEDGSVRIWYGKDRDGKIAYFSSYGLHPQTNKTLRPITKYIIDKYVCN